MAICYSRFVYRKVKTTTYPIQANQLHWFPRLRTLSLAVEDKDAEQGEMQKIHKELLTTQQIVVKLSEQLADLRREVSGR